MEESKKKKLLKIRQSNSLNINDPKNNFTVKSNSNQNTDVMSYLNKN